MEGGRNLRKTEAGGAGREGKTRTESLCGVIGCFSGTIPQPNQLTERMCM